MKSVRRSRYDRRSHPHRWCWSAACRVPVSIASAARIFRPGAPARAALDDLLAALERTDAVPPAVPARAAVLRPHAATHAGLRSMSRAPAASRRVANGEQVQRVAHLAMANKPSVDFTGYWQRRAA